MKALSFKLLLLVGTIALASSARAAWPEKPIRVIIPFSPGGPQDLVLRSVQDEVARQLGQPFIVENREGAAGNIGVTAVAQAAPDGYTLLMASGGNLTVNQHLYRSFRIDPLKAFVPVIHTHDVPAVLMSSAAVPATDLKSFVAYAQARKGTVNYGSPGYGTTPQISLEVLNRSQNMGMTNVSYRGAPAVVNAMVAGDIHLGFAVAGAAAPFVQTGKLRALAVASTKRIALLPDTPTFSELGMGQVASATFWALVAPAGTPEPVLERLNTVLRQALANPDLRKRLEAGGILAAGGTRAEVASLISREAAHWSRVIKDQDIKPLD